MTFCWGRQWKCTLLCRLRTGTCRLDLEVALGWEQALWLNPRPPTSRRLTLVFPLLLWALEICQESNSPGEFSEGGKRKAWSTEKHHGDTCFVKPERAKSFQRQVKRMPSSGASIFTETAKLNNLPVSLITWTFLTSSNTSSHWWRWSSGQTPVLKATSWTDVRMLTHPMPSPHKELDWR